MNNLLKLTSINGDEYEFTVKSPTVKQMRKLNKDRASLVDENGEARSDLTEELVNEVTDTFVEATISNPVCNGEPLDDIFDCAMDVYSVLFTEVLSFLAPQTPTGENTETQLAVVQ